VSERKELSTEMRSLIAAVLCLVVIAAWSLIYKPQQPPPANPAAVVTNPVAPSPGTTPTSVPAEKKPAAPVAPVTMRAASAENSIVIESDL
jgi:YidC/Oxa1 family membrane protein insertase